MSLLVVVDVVAVVRCGLGITKSFTKYKRNTAKKERRKDKLKNRMRNSCEIQL